MSQYKSQIVPFYIKIKRSSPYKEVSQGDLSQIITALITIFILMIAYLSILNSCASKKEIVIIFKNTGKGDVKLKYSLGKENRESSIIPLQEWKVVIPLSNLESQNEWTLRYEATLPDGMIMRRFIDLKEVKNNPLIVELSDQVKRY